MSDARSRAVPTPPPALDLTRIPSHIAIIMDGNGRWAAARGLDRAEGHRAGLEAVRRTIRACRELRVGALTLYAFSTENWRRPAEEVEALMRLLAQAVTDEADELIREGVQIRVSGDIMRLDAELQTQIEQVIATSRNNDALIVNVAYNYGGRAEIIAAVQRLAAEAAGGRLRPEEIDEAAIARRLYTAGLPDPDLLIRTGGEQRISNFLLWQIAYTELYFCEVYWPDFDRTHLVDAIHAYQQRKRRFGGVEGV